MIFQIEEWKKLVTKPKQALIWGMKEEKRELIQLQQAGYAVVLSLGDLDEDAMLQLLEQEKDLSVFLHVIGKIEETCDSYLEKIYARHYGLPVVVCETKHLLIRESILADAQAFADLFADDEYKKYMEVPKNLDSILEIEAYIQEYRKHQYEYYDYGIWSLVSKETGDCIGRAGFEERDGLRLGYSILKEHRRKGFAMEACIALVIYARQELGLVELKADISDSNLISKEFYIKLKKVFDK